MQTLPEKPPTDIGAFLTKGSISDHDLQKEVSEYNRRYLFWDELKYRVKDPEKRKVIWGLMKFLRMLRYEHVSFKCLTLTYSFIPEIVRGLHFIDRYLSGTIRIHNKTIKLEQSYIINSLMEEAIASSILEGAVTTRKKAKDMLLKGRKPKTNSDQMILNNYEAMRFILENKDEPLSKEMILEIHRIVTKGTIEDELVGVFRSTDDIVVADPVTGTIYHTPPDCVKIDEFIQEMCNFANRIEKSAKQSAGEFTHPVIKGIILHYLIGYLHPFNDGNGRTARSIFYWYVLSHGYWLFEYMPISRIILRSKKKYGLSYLYTEYDENDLTYFINYNIGCLQEALEDLLKFLEKKQSEQNATKAIIKKIENINPRQANILRYMMEHSDEYYTIRQIVHMYGIVYQTARTDLLHLVTIGYLKIEKRGREFLFIFNTNSEIWNPKQEEQKIENQVVDTKQRQLDDFPKGTNDPE